MLYELLRRLEGPRKTMMRTEDNRYPYRDMKWRPAKYETLHHDITLYILQCYLSESKMYLCHYLCKFLYITHSICVEFTITLLWYATIVVGFARDSIPSAVILIIYCKGPAGVCVCHLLRSCCHPGCRIRVVCRKESNSTSHKQQSQIQWGVAMKFPEEWFYCKHTVYFQLTETGPSFKYSPWAAMHLVQQYFQCWKHFCNSCHTLLDVFNILKPSSF